MGKKRKALAVIHDAPVHPQTAEQECGDLDKSIIQQIQVMNALRKLFAADGPYAAIQIDTRRIHEIFKKYDRLMQQRKLIFQEFRLVFAWLEDKIALDAETLNRVIFLSNKYKCLSRESVFKQILFREQKISIKLAAWINQINASADKICLQLAEKERKDYLQSPLFTQIDNKAEPSEQFMDIIDVEINSCDAVMQFSEKLMRFHEAIRKLPENFPRKKAFFSIKQGIDNDLHTLLATEMDICVIKDKLEYFSRIIEEQEKNIVEQCKPQNMKFLSLVNALHNKLSSLTIYNPSIAVNTMQQRLIHLKKPRHNEEIIWLEWAVLEEIRLGIIAEINKNHLEMQRQKNIAEDCEEINKIIVAIAVERNRIQQKSLVFFNKDPRINILNNLQSDLTKDIQAYADPRQKKAFIHRVLATFDNCLGEKKLHALTDTIAPPFCTFIRTLLEPLYQILKGWCGAKYMSHFFPSKTEENIAVIAQNAQYRLQEILARMETPARLSF